MFNARAPVITNIQIHLNINAKMARDYSMLAEEITLSCVFGQFVFQKSIVVLAGDTSGIQTVTSDISHAFVRLTGTAITWHIFFTLIRSPCIFLLRTYPQLNSVRSIPIIPWSMDAALNYELIKMSCKIYRHSFCAVVVLDKTICCHYVHLAEKVTPPPPPSAWYVSHSSSLYN